jgi:hypothetical protein
MGRGARLTGKGNVCELLINVVNMTVLKLLSGISPKRYVVRYSAGSSEYVAVKTTGEEAGPNPVV